MLYKVRCWNQVEKAVLVTLPEIFHREFKRLRKTLISPKPRRQKVNFKMIRQNRWHCNENFELEQDNTVTESTQHTHPIK